VSEVATTMKPQVDSLRCPAPLANLPAWVLWRYEYVEGEEKPRKVPYWANGERRHGRHGRPDDRAKLVTFEAAKNAAARRNMDGVGFCPLEDWGIVALDFDDCMRQGQLMQAVESLCAGTYAEYSPSGNGVRAFFRGNLGNRKSHQRKGWPFGFETFSTRGFVTFTGNLLEVTDLCETQDTVADLTPLVRTLYEERFGDRPSETNTEITSTRSPLGLTECQLAHCLEVLDPGLPYDEWIRVGMALHHETSGAGFELWNTWSSDWPSYPGEDSLKSHWNSFGNSRRVVTANWLVHQANAEGAHIDLTTLQVADFEALADASQDDDDGLPSLDAAGAAPRKASRFLPVPWESFANGPQPEWVIKDVIPRADLIVIYGAPAAGKSFAALDMAMCIARGVPWRGKRVKQGRVVYIAAEGAGGFRKRLRAYRLHHDLKGPLPFLVIQAAPNLMLKEDALELARSILAAGGADFIVIDTLAQVTPGANENAGEDMGVLLAHCKGISVACRGAPVALIHHAGKDAAKGARGHSSILAAADTMLRVERRAAGRLIEVEKQKDGEDGISFAFDLEIVRIGEDDDRDPITSCVVRELQALPAQQVRAARRKLGTNEQVIVKAFTVVCESSGDTSADVTEVMDKALDLSPPDQPGRAYVRRQHLKRALEKLCDDESTGYRLEDGRLYAD
jgi:hypothetical protein